MADVPTPTPVEGWARERRLGQFDIQALEDAVARQEEAQRIKLTAARQRAQVAALMLLMGTVAVIVAVTAILGWAWGTGVGGMMMLIMGFLLGRDGSATNERGQ